jgi:hypothetical protein
MQIQTSQFRRSLIAGAGIALASACVGGLALFDWMPGSISGALGAHAAFAANDIAQLHAPTRFPGKARCATCKIDAVPNRAADGDASQGEQCAEGSGSGIPTNAIRDMHAGNLAVLLDWHATARTAYGFDSDGIFCSAQSARTMPLPVAASDIYEQLARPRDATRRKSTHGGSPAAVEKALQKVAD